MEKSFDVTHEGDVIDILSDTELSVAEQLRVALKCFYALGPIANTIPEEHLEKTPFRTVDTMVEMFRGCWENPKEILSAQFSAADYDEIVYVNEISFVSMCAHHGLPFLGKAYFGYLPDEAIVGLSKIPRLVHCYARRPQVQEKLTVEIVDTFNQELKPKGCALVMEAYHLCMAIRGVEEPAYTKTTALRGCFKTDQSAKQEFLQGIKRTSEQLWP